MEWIVDTIDKTMQQSLLQDFRSYLQLNDFKEFIIYSDYCFDKNRPNKVATFTVSPAWTIFPGIADRIEKIIPKDTKDQTRISDEVVNVLTNKLFFHINFLISDVRGVTSNKKFTDQDVALTSIDETIKMIQGWLDNQPEGAEKFKQQIKRFSIWKCELQSKSPNLSLFRNIVVISLLAGYIAYMLTKEAKIEMVAWFSDRDKIIDKGFAYDLFEMTHTGLCENTNIESSNTKLGFGVQDENTNELWYDPLIRIPDYLAGALSSWDLSENRVITNKKVGKQITLLQKVFCDNPFCQIIRIDFGRDRYICGRHTVSPLNMSV